MFHGFAKSSATASYVMFHDVSREFTQCFTMFHDVILSVTTSCAMFHGMFHACFAIMFHAMFHAMFHGLAEDVVSGFVRKSCDSRSPRGVFRQGRPLSFVFVKAVSRWLSLMAFVSHGVCFLWWKGGSLSPLPPSPPPLWGNFFLLKSRLSRFRGKGNPWQA